jgi:type 1 glutamine amidotransferase
MICSKFLIITLFMLSEVSSFASLKDFSFSSHGQSIRLLVITGGHDYNSQEFENMLDSLPGSITYKIAALPEAFTLFEGQHRAEYDVILFYHMWQRITQGQANDMAECIREGKPLVVLHHSICAFDNWDEYTNITGGRYFHRTDTIDGRIYPVSSYRHDVDVSVRISDKDHPVTAGIEDFVLYDETYNDFYVQPEVTPLLITDTPGSTEIIGWTKQYGKSRVVTLQSGHDVPTFRSPEYRQLLWQAIEWAGERQVF